MSKFSGLKIDQINYSYNKYGKPYLNNSNIQFNISHSKNIIIICVSNHYEPIGIDVEYIDKKLNIHKFKKILAKNEYKSLINDKNKIYKFFQYWTLKESYTKMIGKGFFEDFHNIDFSNLEKKLKL